MVRIPSEYQEVEYLESTGTQWIDSGKFWEKDDCIQISFMLPYSMTNFDKSLFGCYANGSQICELNINSKYFRFDVMTYSSFQIDAYKIYSISKDGNKWFVDGEDQNTNTYNATITTHTNILFGRWYDNSATKLIKARVYSYKQTRNNVLILNFIPCYRKSDSEPGMYDTISKTFFTNQGTGTFLVGRDVTYSTVNLLESRRRILLSTPHIESKSSLSPMTFSTDVATDLKECKIHFSPVQEGSGTPSPENVRAIRGWDGITITYNGNQISLSFPKTIYGGYVDLIKGEVVEEWGEIASYDGETVGAQWVSSTGALTTGAQVAYLLATPTTYPLTPQSLKSLRGLNNILTDANGNIDIKFYSH